MILSIIFSVISLVVFVFQLFTMEKGNRFFLSGATMLVCCEYPGSAEGGSHVDLPQVPWPPEQMDTLGSSLPLLFGLFLRTPDSCLDAVPSSVSLLRHSTSSMCNLDAWRGQEGGSPWKDEPAAMVCVTVASVRMSFFPNTHSWVEAVFFCIPRQPACGCWGPDSKLGGGHEVLCFTSHL